MTPKKKIKDYLQRSVRKLKHRKGFGVHSPFAFDVITQVIEEKLPYYAYRHMQPLYAKGAPMPFKVACLLLRLANRFGVRMAFEIGCDGGYSVLPLLLTDSHLQVCCLATPEAQAQTLARLKPYTDRLSQVQFATNPDEGEAFLKEFLPGEEAASMLIVNDLPEWLSASELVHDIVSRLAPSGVLFVHGIQPGHKLEAFWDELCDCEEVPITMDLYDYGLAIIRPRFFKQHYVVSF